MDKLSEVELKAKCYEVIVEIERLQNFLRALNQELAKKSVEPKAEVKQDEISKDN